MTTEQLAAAIREKLEAVIAAADVAEQVTVDEKHPAWLWFGSDPHPKLVGTVNAVFIAQARTTSPQTARALLLALDWMERALHPDPNAGDILKGIADELGIETGDGATLEEPPTGTETAEPL